jgi:cytochrome c-type biogenesis protein
VGVSNEEMSTLRGFIKNNKYTFPIAQDGKRDVHQRYGIRAFPTTFLIGRDGKIREQIVGTLSEAALRRKIEALLGERAQGQ